MLKTKSHSRRATIRRRLIPAQDAPRGIHAATLKSRTREDGTRWHPHIDTATGAFWCDCPAGQHHKLCWHVQRLRDHARRHGQEVPNVAARRCIHCHEPGAEYEVVSDAGQVIPGAFICLPCIKARLDDADLCPPDHDGLMAAAPNYDQSLEDLP